MTANEHCWGEASLFPIPRNASEDDRAYYRRVTDALKEGQDLQFGNKNYERARFIVGSLLEAAEKEVFLYFRNLADYELDAPDQMVNEHIVDALRGALVREVHVGVVTDRPVDRRNPLRQLLESHVTSGRVDFRVLNDRGREKVGGTPHFVVMDARAYRIETDPRNPRCSANAHFNEPELAKELADTFREVHLSPKYSDPA